MMEKTTRCSCKSGCRNNRCKCLKQNEPCDENCGCTDARNAANTIGIRFVGAKLFKTIIPGTARHAEIAEIGGNGTAKTATSAPMVLRCHVSAAAQDILTSKGFKGRAELASQLTEDTEKKLSR
jgi:hypothetical protein